VDKLKLVSFGMVERLAQIVPISNKGFADPAAVALDPRPALGALRDQDQQAHGLGIFGDDFLDHHRAVDSDSGERVRI